MNTATINFAQFDISSLLLALPEIFLLSAIVIILLFDLFFKKTFINFSYYSSQLSLLVCIILCFNLIQHESAVVFNNSFIFDSLAVVLKIFILGSTMIVLVYSRHYLKIHSLLKGEYFIISLLAVLGMMVMTSGHSLLILYLGLEIMSLSLYTLIAMASTRTNAIEAALKYFILSAISSGLLLYGMSMIYGISLSLVISDIAAFSSSASLSDRELLIINFGLVFLVIGVAFKLGVVPFHMWIPDVYQGSPSSVTMFLATAPKIAMVVFVIRLLVEGLESMHTYWSDLFMLLALLSIILGSVVALMQINIKRMLAYSTISHMGFVLLGFITGVISGYAASIFYILAYSLTSLAIFGIIIMLNKSNFEAEHIVDYKGLNKRAPLIAFFMLIAMLSMAGVPPFIGFYAKLIILQQIIAQGYIWIALIVVIFAVVSSYYYLKVIKVMYFDEAQREISILAPMDMRLLLSINALLILLVGLFPNYFIDLTLQLLLK